MIVRDDKTPRIKIERTPHGAAQWNDHSATTAAFVKILGDEQPFLGKEKNHYAFLAPHAQTTDKVLAKLGNTCVERLAGQCLACGGLRKLACGDDCGTNGPAWAPVFALGQRIVKRLGRSGPDRPQRTETADQPPCNGF